MEVKLTLEIQDLHACPGDREPKKIEVPKDVFSQIEVLKTTSEIDAELALEREKAKAEEKTRVKIEPLQAFKEDDGNLVFRLGGAYGKLMGLFKEAGSALYSSKAEGFKSSYKPLLKSLVVKPQWVILKDADKPQINKIPQITAGRSQSMIIQYYETIPKCIVEVTIQVPEKEKTRFKAMLKQAEGMPFGPKRRGEIKVLEEKWT